MGFWDRLEENDFNQARGTQGGLYFKPGNYLVQIQRCKMITTQQNHEAFVAEFKVIETDVEDPNLKPGAEPSYFVDMDGKYPELALGNVADITRAGLASLACMHGEEHPPIEQIELTKEVGKAVTGKDNLLAGVYLSVYAFNKPTREGNDFTRFKWRIPENIAELAAQAA